MALPACLPAAAFAATFAVDRLDDEPTATDCNPLTAIDCSLRGAITASNLTPGADIITVPAGTYPLVHNQLSISDDVEVAGAAGAASVIRQDTPFSRVFFINASTVELSGLTVTGGGGEEFANGAGIYHIGGKLEIHDSRIEDNRTGLDGWGGGISSSSASASLTVIDSAILLNESTSGSGIGGGIYASGSVEIVSSVIGGNKASTAAPGLYLTGGSNVMIRDSEIVSNEGGFDAGGIYKSGGTLTVIRSQFVSNKTNAEGGAIRMVSSGVLVAIETQFQDNFAGAVGGAIWSNGSVEIIDSEFWANQVGSDTTGLGGAIFLDGGANLDVRETLFRENMSVQEAGGIYIDIGATALVTNVTFSGNTATGFGGGISNGGNLTLVNATFSNNTAAHGDAIDLSVGTTNIRNALIDGQCSAFLPTVNSQGGNLESSGDTCFLDAPSDQVGVTGPDLALAALANNGGSTRTHELLPGSVAINGGVADCPLVDQRGWTRIDGLCDVGAFEVGADPVLIFADGFESGDVSVWTSSVP